MLNAVPFNMDLHMDILCSRRYHHSSYTCIYVVSNRTNTTSTLTKYNELPDGYTLPTTNAASTLTTTLTIPARPNGSTTTVSCVTPVQIPQTITLIRSDCPRACPTVINDYGYSCW